MYPLDINFLKDRGFDDAVETQSQAPKKPASIAEKIPIVVGGIIAIALPLLSFQHARSFEAKQAEAQSQIAEVEAEIAKKQGENQTLEQMQTQVQAAKTETQALVQVFDKIRPWSAILQEIRDRTPPGVQVDSLSQSGSGSEIDLQISGSARSYDDVNDFVLFLQRSPFFDKNGIILGNVNTGDLQIDVANQEELPENVSFTLPQGVQYSITAQLNNLPSSGLIKELQEKGSIGVLTRLKTLEQQGAITK
jgi:type IV pilus assembly protein PilN